MKHMQGRRENTLLYPIHVFFTSWCISTFQGGDAWFKRLTCFVGPAGNIFSEYKCRVHVLREIVSSPPCLRLNRWLVVYFFGTRWIFLRLARLDCRYNSFFSETYVAYAGVYVTLQFSEAHHLCRIDWTWHVQQVRIFFLTHELRYLLKS
jgi:hypothetical protein